MSADSFPIALVLPGSLMSLDGEDYCVEEAQDVSPSFVVQAAAVEPNAVVADVDQVKPTGGNPSSTLGRLQAWVQYVAEDTQTQIQEFLEQVDARQSGE
jgi:hypothetical protein